MTRLSKGYLKLRKAGCVLFNNWTATFKCSPDPDRPVCATLEFGTDIPQLKVSFMLQMQTKGLEDKVDGLK